MQEKFKKFLFLFQLHQNIFSSMCYTGVTVTTAIAHELSNPREGQILPTITEVTTKFSPWLRPCATYDIGGLISEDIFTLIPSLKKFFLKKDSTIEKFGPKIAKCVNKIKLS